MDAITPKTQVQFLPALAEQIAEWFPELKGRSIAVSEVSITQENIPTLPLAVTAFTNGLAEPPTRTRMGTFDMADTFIVEFWLEPARYKKADGSETPFWSYYPYEEIRDNLLSHISEWDTPNGEIITYRRLQIGAEPFAVTLTFTFLMVFRWCSSLPPAQGIPFKLAVNILTPKDCCIPEEPDPCP